MHIKDDEEAAAAKKNSLRSSLITGAIKSQCSTVTPTTTGATTTTKGTTTTGTTGATTMREQPQQWNTSFSNLFKGSCGQLVNLKQISTWLPLCVIIASGHGQQQ